MAIRSTGAVRGLCALIATGLLAAVSLVAATSVGATPAGASTNPLPVPYDFLTSAVAGGAQSPNAGPPGSNDWSCRPSAAHPEPIVLVHGLFGNATTNWQTYGPLLKNNDYCVFALTYGQSPDLPSPLNQYIGGLTSVESSAAQLAPFVQRVLAATHASKVDIVGHSEGTVVPEYYAKYLGGARYIDKYVSLAPLWHGTNPAGLATAYHLASTLGLGSEADSAFRAFIGSGSELLTGSPYMQKMEANGGPAVPGITYTNIVTRYDELVEPYTSGIQAGMTNYTVQDLCPTDFTDHVEIASDPVAAALVLNALDPAHPRPVPCKVVLPLIGTS